MSSCSSHTQIKNISSSTESKNMELNSENLKSSLKVRILTKLDIGRWRKEEHELFLKGLQIYGRDWKKIEQLVGTRTGPQIRSHAQKHFNKINKGASNTYESTSDHGMISPSSSHSEDTLIHLEKKNEEIKSIELQSAFTKVEFKPRKLHNSVCKEGNDEAIKKCKLDIPNIDFDYPVFNPSVSAENCIKKECTLNEKTATPNYNKENSKTYSEDEVLMLLKYLIKEFASIMNRLCAFRQPSLMNCFNLMNLNSLVSLSMLAGDQTQSGVITSMGLNAAQHDIKLDASATNYQNIETTNFLIRSLQSSRNNLDFSVANVHKLSDWINLDQQNFKSSSGVANPSQSNKAYFQSSEPNLNKLVGKKHITTFKKYDISSTYSESFFDDIVKDY